MYFWKLGYLDGLAGLWLAFYSALYFFATDRKLTQLYAGKEKGFPG